MVDLHLHTTASDGKLSPSQLVERAAARGLRIIAITDHDSTEGIASALETARKYPQLTIIPGIEISTDIPGGEVHVLGYFIDYESPQLQRDLAVMRVSRERRALNMINKLTKLGINITWERVKELAGGGSVGRPHVAEAMLEKGYISSHAEAFAKYIGREGPAYAEREKLTPVGAVRLIVEAGGLPVLAHPGDIENLDAMIPELISAGLVGMEAYYDGYDADTVARLVAEAQRYNLIPCGGSDYHGPDSGVETGLGEVSVPMESAERLMSLSVRNHQKRRAVS